MGVTERPGSDPPRTWATATTRTRALAGSLLARTRHRSDLPNPRAYIRLGGGLVLLSVAVMALPGAPIAMFSPQLAVAMAATDAAIGVMLLQLGLLRFGALGSLLDLLAGLGFGTLALANLVVRVVSVATGGLRFEIGLGLLLLSQMLAAILFLAGLVFGQHRVPPEQRRAVAVRLLGFGALTLVAGSGGAVAGAAQLGGALDDGARAALAERAPVHAFLAGQAGWLVLLDGVVMVLFLLAALGYVRASGRLRDPQTAVTAAALLLLSFGQLHAVLVPPVDTGYIGTPEVLRLSAYLTVLFSLAGRLGTEIASRAAQDERLRLSRELHDGLAQQLSLLHLRLSRATAPERPAETRARDLASAQRLVEAALLEARQGIAVLRTGRISWQELTGAVVSFADEFAGNHDIDVNVTTEGELPPVDAELQLEVLRVVQEAFSNALRHGCATRLEIALAGTPAGLNLTIRDNGRGFDIQRALVSKGVGLDSMIERLQRRRGSFRIDSQPGKGATVHVWLPVAGARTQPAPLSWTRGTGHLRLLRWLGLTELPRRPVRRQF